MTPRAISHPEPSRTQLRVFAVLLPVFFVLLGLMAIRRPQGLVIAAGVCTVTTLAAVALDAKKRAANLVGLAIPLLLMLIALPVRTDVPPRIVAAGCVIGGMILGL